MQDDHAIASFPERGHFDGVVVFLKVAERRSFRVAAEELGLSPSSVGQIVRALEARVGAPLLARTTRRVGLTEAGEKFLPGAREAVRSMDEAARAARSLSESASGTLRLTMPRVVSYALAPPLLADFCTRHPALEVELHADDRMVDLVEEGFDAGIRPGELIARDMVAVRITPAFPFVVVASPDYLAKHGVPSRPEDLARHRCIRFRQAASQGVYRWEFVRGKRSFSLAVSGGIVLNDSHLNVLAALSGGGLAYMALPLVKQHVDDGRLVRVLDRYLPRTSGMFVCYPSRNQALPKLRAFVEFARDRFAHLV